MLSLIRNSRYQLPTHLERGLKYYLIQTFSGLLFIISWALATPLISLLTLRIILKLGVFPFRFWVIPILSNQTWVNLWLLSTIIKVPPLLILHHSWVSPTLLIITIFHGAILALFMLKVKALLATSRLINTSWVGLLTNRVLWLCFIVLYSIILLFTLLLINRVMTSNFKYSRDLGPCSPFLLITFL